MPGGLRLGFSASPMSATLNCCWRHRVVRREWGFVLGLVAITLVVIGLVIYFGLKLNKAILRNSQKSDSTLSTNLFGTKLLELGLRFMHAWSDSGLFALSRESYGREVRRGHSSARQMD